LQYNPIALGHSEQLALTSAPPNTDGRRFDVFPDETATTDFHLPSTPLSSISAQRQGSPGKTDEDCQT
jgi:hypothetical protein